MTEQWSLDGQRHLVTKFGTVHNLKGKMEMENSWWFVSFKIPWPRPLASRTCQRTFPEPYKVNLIR